jgi:uncharacterized protein (DUF2249 family)
MEVREVAGHNAHECRCSRDVVETNVLDTRTIPHPVRHGAVFGAIEASQPNGSFVFVAPRDQTHT